ncbi:hypothetical protein Godav_029925 [Gossypium davidsonii]|uniref:Leucine-rich repeat-containing N-terminal plant-type domain-containing protein n=1 Tax=Gossypium davidsonii TaxID=34287 RepID=A0A7J8TJN1_GOSDV|nr:hypothetical protein [Gossypium davidsonii]
MFMRGRGLHFHFHLSLALLFALIAASFGISVKNQSVRCIAAERRALLDFKKGLINYDNSLNLLVSWTSKEEKCCKWKGVGCDNTTGHVVMLDLRSRITYGIFGGSLTVISGEIGTSLLELKHLSHLDLSLNHFYQIADFIGSLSDLTYHNLSSNPLTGFIPHQLVDSTFPLLVNISRNLVELDLHHNQLSSLIPKSFDNMPALERINFEDNSLEGGIPKSLGNLCHLKELNLRDNKLSGPLTFAVTNLSGCAKNSLEILFLDDNNFNGSLPNFVRFSSLRELTVACNRLSGHFEDNFGNFSKITVSNLDKNRITGPLLDLSKLSSLRKLSLRGNQLEGLLPVNIGKLSQLVLLDVSNNSLHDVISEAHLFNLTKLRYLLISFNALSFNLSSN